MAITLFDDCVERSYLVFTGIPVYFEVLFLFLFRQFLVEAVDNFFVGSALERDGFAFIVEAYSVRQRTSVSSLNPEPQCLPRSRKRMTSTPRRHVCLMARTIGRAFSVGDCLMRLAGFSSLDSQTERAELTQRLFSWHI